MPDTVLCAIAVANSILVHARPLVYDGKWSEMRACRSPLIRLRTDSGQRARRSPLEAHSGAGVERRRAVMGGVDGSGTRDDMRASLSAKRGR